MRDDRKTYVKNLNWGIIWKENCPFCDLEWQSELIIWKGKYWFIQYNKYPYLGLKNHIMAIPYSHKWFTYELTPEEFSEMSEIEKFVKSFYWDSEYFSFIREGKWGRSIEHLHYHFLPWILYAEYLEEMLKKQGY